MSDVRNLLAAAPLLATLDAEEREQYLRDGSFHVLAFGQNDIVHLVGETCSRLDIILEGEVLIEHSDEEGRQITIAEFYSGDVLSGNLVFSQNPIYPMTVTARQPSRILQISRERLLDLFTANRPFLQSYLAYVSDHTMILGDRIKHYTGRSLRERLQSYLLFEYKKQASRILRLPMTKKALADKVGVQRTSLSRELAKMRADGLLLFDAETIELLDPFFRM